MVISGAVSGDNLILQTLGGASVDAGNVRGGVGNQGPPGNPTAYELRGAGFPENAVSAPVGTYYTDTLATNGAIRWVKAQGSGSTGWRVVYGDTGWRNVESLIQAICTSNGLTYARKGGYNPPAVRRINDTVWFDAAFTITGNLADVDFKTALGQVANGIFGAKPDNRQIPPTLTGSAGVIHWGPSIYVKFWTAGDIFLPQCLVAKYPWSAASLIGIPA